MSDLASSSSPEIRRMALCHLAPVPDDLQHNRRTIERALEQAANLGAHWIVTPELSSCGYQFARHLGTDWITVQPDPWVKTLMQFAAEHQVHLFLGHAEADVHTGKLHNAVLAISDQGELLGSARKHNVLPGSEGWSTRSQQAAVFEVQDIKVGVLICADAYTSKVSRELLAQGAQMILAPSAWGPGLHGPEGEWESRSLDTGIPVVVCNRTGAEGNLSFEGSTSGFIRAGKREKVFEPAGPALILLDWTVQDGQVVVLSGREVPLEV
ncbi:carbon-nitrogen hydrolase family protein [Deinococcus roseus]|uniref:CN hydrolase domain-containing protein n=1 Tax=Deinococcus roseus TaxID=392414 RepID=A0ABQ2D2L0_9DEIO|nr:carbon-nitrogen hydrolase family protein [Deinococcus roseus]GGJ43379.1 hypothetical protein GCM10008938_32060 [Deinococcus roseus]